MKYFWKLFNFKLFNISMWVAYFLSSVRHESTYHTVNLVNVEHGNLLWKALWHLLKRRFDFAFFSRHYASLRNLIYLLRQLKQIWMMMLNTEYWQDTNVSKTYFLELIVPLYIHVYTCSIRERSLFIWTGGGAGNFFRISTLR